MHQARPVPPAAAFGQRIEDVFTRLSAIPIASASLGQVYKGTLSPAYGGGEVAVKVQRPSVMESVALDLFLMRRLALFLRRFPQVWLPPDSWACKQTPAELSLPGQPAAACARSASGMGTQRCTAFLPSSCHAVCEGWHACCTATVAATVP